MNLNIYSLLLALSLIPILCFSSFASDKELQTIEGQIFCVEQDDEGKINSLVKYEVESAIFDLSDPKSVDPIIKQTKLEWEKQKQ